MSDMSKNKRFEHVWGSVQSIRRDRESMKILDELIKKHTS